MLACGMSLRLASLLVVLALPAWAQSVAAPDCTADVEVARDLKLDIHYRCRSAAAITFTHAGRVEPANGLVEAYYRFDLATHARSVDSTREIVMRGEGVLAVLSSWLDEPQGYQRAPIIDIRVRTAPGHTFASGLPRVGDAWRLAGIGVRFAGYTVFGHVSLTEVAVPAPGSLRAGAAKQDGVLHLAILDGASDTARADLVDWVRRTAEAESNYWQGFTARQMMVALVPMAGKRGVGYGRTVPGGGPTIMVEVAVDTDRRRLFDDWVLVHELVHTAMPFVLGRTTWFMEGAATYVEPVIRARAGWKTEEEVWKEWVDNMPRGTAVFAAGMATAAGQQNYWGGALFMLLADIGLRRATQGARGLEDCLGGVLWNGLDGAQRVALDAYAEACDRATGTKVMSELIDRHYAHEQPVDLVALWRELGVALVGGRIALDDTAPSARWRKMIVPGTRPAKRVKLPWES
jgi:hypothetical protein